jgi:GMP synthase (glutamine-hydrolysing)
MELLIIDNGTSYLSELKKLLGNYPFEVISYSEISNIADLNNYDAIILSGGHNFPVAGNEVKLETEISLVRNTQKPVFGICFGFELIAAAFRAKLELMQSKEKEIIEIEIVNQDDIFKGLPNFKVFENHRWVVKELPENLSSLAVSKFGIEAIKHKTLPIYGVQFHPGPARATQTIGDIFRIHKK